MRIKDLKKKLQSFNDNDYVYIQYDGMILSPEGKNVIVYYDEDLDMDAGLVVIKNKLKVRT